MDLKTAIEYGEKAIQRNSKIITLIKRGNGRLSEEAEKDLRLENTAIRTLVNTAKENIKK